jgi:hypothetical protein
MNDGGPHVVVAVMGAIAVIVLLEFQFADFDLARLLQENLGNESVRFRYLVTRFQVSVAAFERKLLSAAVRPDGFDGEVGGRWQAAHLCPDAKPRRHVVFEDFDFKRAAAQGHTTRLFAVRMVAAMRVIMAVAVMMAAGQ